MILEKKKLLNSKCMFRFPRQISSETFLTLRRTERDMIKKYLLVFTHSTRYSCPVLMKFKFSRVLFQKNILVSNFMKIRPVGSELLHADGRTDMTKHFPISELAK